MKLEDLHDDRLLSRDEVEAHFGISKRFLEISAHRGDGPPMTFVGRLRRYRITELRKWIADRTATSAPRARS